MLRRVRKQLTWASQETVLRLISHTCVDAGGGAWAWHAC